MPTVSVGDRPRRGNFHSDYNYVTPSNDLVNIHGQATSVSDEVTIVLTSCPQVVKLSPTCQRYTGWARIASCCDSLHNEC